MTIPFVIVQMISTRWAALPPRVTLGRIPSA
jgi:hypothetical protein